MTLCDFQPYEYVTQDRGLESDKAGFLLFVLFVSSVVWRAGVVFLLKQSERKKSKLVHMQDHR
jgi:hypothetical protein